MEEYIGSALYLRNISKTFGTSKALDNVSMKIMPGEIHGLLGQNGCGKSTLIKILSGFHEPDSGGKLWIDGKRVRLPLQTGEFSKYRMSFVHQDLGLIPELTVLENFKIGKIAMSGSIRINWKREAQRTKEILNKYQVHISPKDAVGSLSQVEKAMLAIVRAVEFIRDTFKPGEKKSGILVLDEPTVFLPRAEVNMLFKLVHMVASEGISVLFVSHDLDEVMELTDTITVLRDGRNAGDLITKETTKKDVIRAILGRELEIYKMHENTVHEKSGTAVHIEKAGGDLVRNISFSVKPGEVLGLTGLVGSGFEEMPYLLFGSTGRLSNKEGSVEIDGKRLDLSTITQKEALKSGIALIPADRPNQGGIFDISIAENMMMLTLDRYNKKMLNKNKLFENCRELLKQYEVNTGNPKLNFGALSGGNQQKVLLAKWLQINPKLLILHEPTQGVDIGARQQVFRHIAEATKAGSAVICSSSDYEQLEQICDRVLIFVRGNIKAELVGSEITKENIVRYCYNSGKHANSTHENDQYVRNYEKMRVTAV